MEAKTKMFQDREKETETVKASMKNAVDDELDNRV